MAGGSAAVYAFIAPLTPPVVVARPPCPTASIRTFVEPLQLVCLLEFSFTSGRCHLPSTFRFPLCGKLVVQAWAQSPELGGTSQSSFPKRPVLCHSKVIIPRVSLPRGLASSGRHRLRRLALARPQQPLYLARDPQGVKQNRQLPRSPPMRAFFLAPLPPRAASFCPHRRKSLSVPWRPRITCAPCTSSFRR